MSNTHEIYNKLYQASRDNQFDKTELYQLITEQNINDTDENGHTLLHLAAVRGDKDLVNYLLDKNADVTLLDEGDWSVLRGAIEAISEDNFAIQDGIIKALLRKGANINEKENGTNYSLLHNAIASGSVIKAQVIIANSAELTGETFHFKTARQLAAECSPEIKNQMLALLDTPVAALSALINQHSIFALSKASATSEQVNPNLSTDVTNEHGASLLTHDGENPQSAKTPGK